MPVKNDIIKENRKRLAQINAPYNPVTGEGATSVEREKVYIQDCPIETLYLPATFVCTPFVQALIKYGYNSFIKTILKKGVTATLREELWKEFIKERIKHDFEYWAYSFIEIKAKGKPYDIPFKLNRAQRKLLYQLEKLRLAGVPIKIILLKARQWGGSTLAQMYMLWIQLVHRNNWNSVICGDVETQSRTVRSMVTKALKRYPSWLQGKIKFSPFEGSQKNKIIENTNCVISMGSAQKPDSLRSSDISMAHLTEIGLWKETKGKKPEDLVQSIVGSIYDTPYSVQILESTAKGIGNFFHREWITATSGKSNFTPVFIPWFIIDIYSQKIENYYSFMDTMEEYDWMLWDLGATLEAIAWYKKKSKDLKDNWRMNSEYPSTANEAFQSSGRRKFRMEDVRKLEKTCIAPSFIGEITGEKETGPDAIKNIRFHRGEGNFSVWTMPDISENWRDRYIIVVDVGGVSDTADYSDITVFDRYFMNEGGIPEVVAEWHGHIDHDKLAWKAAQIATAYGNGLLVIESNTMETEGTEGDNFEYILDEISKYYTNLYSRTPADQIKQGAPVRWGFHTNTSTKPMVIAHEVKVIRDGLYIERCQEAVWEHDTFEIKEDGKTMGAVEGMHDDRLMVRAIGNWICYNWPLPVLLPSRNKKGSGRKIISEASM